MVDRLGSNAKINVNESITSSSGNCELILQTDGNLVLYSAGRTALWATSTFGQTDSYAIQQTDGNFVLYGSGRALWASNTDGNEGATLVLQDDGNLVIYGASGGALWASNTSMPQSSTSSTSTREYELGSTDGIPEVRITWSGVETRSTTYRAYVSIDADISDQSWDAVRDCALIAGGGAVLASIFSLGAGALPAFWATFSGCVAQRGVTIASDGIRFRTETTHGDWDQYFKAEISSTQKPKTRILSLLPKKCPEYCSLTGHT